MKDSVHPVTRLRTPVPQHQTQDGVDVSALIRPLWRGRWWVCFSVLTALGIAALYLSFFAQPTYRATAVVVLEPNQRQILDLADPATGLSGDMTEVNSERAVFRARSVLGRVVDGLELTKDPAFHRVNRSHQSFPFLRGSDSTPNEAQLRDHVISALRDTVRVTNLRNSFVFEITASAGDPDSAAKIADAVVSAYLADRLSAKRATLEQADHWLSDRVNTLQRELTQAEVAVAKFSTSTDLVSVEALNIMERQAKELRERITQQEQALKLAERGQSQLGALRASEAALVERIAQQNRDLVTLKQLTQEVEATRALYTHVLTRMKENKTQLGMQRADGRVLSSAVVPTQPAAPHAERVLTLAILFGIVMGAGGVIGTALFCSRFETAAGLEAGLKLPVMGVLPNMEKSKSADLLPSLIRDPGSPVFEGARTLRTALMLADSDLPPQVILVSSARPKEGKTHTALALGQSYVSLGKRVLVVDANLRTNTFPQFIRDMPGAGLIQALSGDRTLATTVYRNAESGLDILGTGGVNLNATDLFAAPEFHALLEEAREHYDIVVIDSPPLLDKPDARIIAPLCDAVLLCVRAARTTKAEALRAIDTLGTSHQRICGTVFIEQ